MDILATIGIVLLSLGGLIGLMRMLGVGKKKDLMTALSIVFIVLGLISVSGLVKLGTGATGGDTDYVIQPGDTPAALGCPTDGDSSLKIDVVNSANESGSEGYDVTGYLYIKESDGTLTSFATISDTTAATATLIDCGKDYVFKIISTSGAGGDGSYVKKIISGKGTIDSNGNLEFRAASSNPSFVIGVDQNAALKVRALDNNDASNYLCDNDETCSAYETDGITFVSTTNGTVIDETVGLDITFQFLATDVADNGNDRGLLVMLEMPTTTWSSTPEVYANGVALTEMKGQLNPFEATAYSGYEYIYLIPRNVQLKDGSQGITLRVVNNLAAGVATSSADPEVDIAPRGAYLGIDAISVGYGAVKDDSSRTVVNTLFDITLDVTA